MKTNISLALTILLAPLPVAAQVSSSYEIKNPTIHNGGSPSDGVNPTSATYEIAVEALGESPAGGPTTSASYEVVAGFVVTQLDLETIFIDGFESGGVSAWSTTVGGGTKAAPGEGRPVIHQEPILSGSMPRVHLGAETTVP